ncbi:Chromate resistance protein ChrB [Phaeacidiphilus oryzae]|uniref:Chromate resistance protein ChrB n=1 Tax=Phaeacidiphilus oryzae TaxID=348818 RepID=UPI0005602C26|nr:Chromate resistance protein ChrB [Phaeacidiphilus oryzae]
MNAHSTDPTQWKLLILRLPAQPSRHRVAVWRELRRVGALSLGQGVWAVPEVPVFEAGVHRALALAAQAPDGEALTLRATGGSARDGARLAELFSAAREEEWAEFLADCGKYQEELEKEIRTRKFTLAELEEEEQSLERLRRWHRDIRSRDVFGAPSAEVATSRLDHCADSLQEYSELVLAHLHAFDHPADGPS